MVISDNRVRRRSQMPRIPRRTVLWELGVGVGLSVALNFSTSCARAPREDAIMPFHVHILCTTDANGALDCSAEDRRSAFDAWVTTAIRTPRSTFTVWLVGHDRHTAVVGFVACMPESWGAG